MTNDEFKEKLQKIGINKKEFAEQFNISQSAVNNWSNKPIPAWVDAAVDLLQEHRICIEENVSLRGMIAKLQDKDVSVDTPFESEPFKRKFDESMRTALAKLKDEMKAELEADLRRAGVLITPDDSDKN